MAVIPAEYEDLIQWDTKAFAQLALTLADGTPHVSPIWFDWDGTHIVVNTARGRVKDRVMRRKPAVALAISDPRDPYRYILIRGRVDEETEEGADEMIRRLSEKYTGNHAFTGQPGEVRVTYKILPERVTG